MKKIKLLSVMLVMLLFCIGSNNVFAQHFGNVNGSPFGDQWTLYLTDINIDATQPANGDELAVFDGTKLVGLYTFDGTENYVQEGTTNPLVTFQQLNSGLGYTVGNNVTFKFWDNSESLEITGVFVAHNTYDINFDDNDNDDYVELGWNDAATFPTEDNPYSYIALNFTSGNSVSGLITIDGTCNGAMEDVIVYAYNDGTNDIVGSAVPDATSGIYTINGLQDGNVYKITASLTNYTSIPGTHTATINGANLTKNFTLNPYQGSITGTVTSSATGGTFTGISVSLYDASDNQVGTPQSTSNGAYSFVNLCMGTYYVIATHDDYTNETSADVTLSTNGQSEIIDFALDPLPGFISGTVTDSYTHEPIEGVTAHCTNHNVEPPVEFFWTYTNATGYYKSSDDILVPAGTWYVVFELDHYKKDSILVTVTANTTTTGNDIALEMGPGILKGVVTDAVTNAFIDDVSVDIVPDGLPGTSTAADGSYEFPAALSGTYNVNFTKAGYTTQTFNEVVINSTYITTLNVALQPDPGNIFVTVNDEGGIPMTGATVTIGDDHTATFVDPKYRFYNMPVGTYDVTIKADGYHTETIEGVEVTSNVNTPAHTTLIPYHNEYVTGSSFDEIWTIFLQGATIDGVPVEENDEIAIYDELVSNVHPVGVYYIEEALTSWTATSHQLKAYSVITSGTGYTVGNTYTFKLWDNSANVEYTASGVSLTDPNNEGAFTGTVFPTGDNPISFANLTFNAEVTLNYALHNGYQIISSRVEADNMEMGTIMHSVKSRLDYVKDELGHQYRKINNTWTNNIGDWEITEGYLVKMNHDKNLIIDGLPQNAQTEIPLVAGYNLISFLPENAMNAATAFNAIKDNISFVRNSAGNHFWKIGGTWVNNIGDLQPTEGYFVKMNADDILIYPNAKSVSNTKSQQLQHFNFVSGDPTDAVYTVYATGVNLNIGDEVAVFDGDKMVGAAVINSEKEAMANNINVFNTLPEGNGFTAGHNITYKVWKQINNTEYGSIEVEYTNPNGDAYTEGTFPAEDEHYSIAKLNAAELSINEEILQGLSLYPNPTSDRFRLTSKNEIEKIRIISVTGQVLLAQPVNNNSIEINTNSFKAGIYIIESTIKQKTFILRFAVK